MCIYFVDLTSLYYTTAEDIVNGVISYILAILTSTTWWQGSTQWWRVPTICYYISMMWWWELLMWLHIPTICNIFPWCGASFHDMQSNMLVCIHDGWYVSMWEGSANDARQISFWNSPFLWVHGASIRFCYISRVTWWQVRIFVISQMWQNRYVIACRLQRSQIQANHEVAKQTKYEWTWDVVSEMWCRLWGLICLYTGG